MKSQNDIKLTRTTAKQNMHVQLPYFSGLARCFIWFSGEEVKCSSKQGSERQILLTKYCIPLGIEGR